MNKDTITEASSHEEQIADITNAASLQAHEATKHDVPNDHQVKPTAFVPGSIESISAAVNSNAYANTIEAPSFDTDAANNEMLSTQNFAIEIESDTIDVDLNVSTSVTFNKFA